MCLIIIEQVLKISFLPSTESVTHKQEPTSTNNKTDSLHPSHPDDTNTHKKLTQFNDSETKAGKQKFSSSSQLDASTQELRAYPGTRGKIDNSRKTRKSLLTLHTDIIGNAFWKTYPHLLGKDTK